MLNRLTILFILLAIFSLAPQGAQAQDPQCGYAMALNYPINTDVFQLVQDYGTASPRHQGRYHTGEDWSAGADVTLNQPVRAAAAGRVTYSGPRGWGRDGGAIVIEHTLPDDSIIYTQYGHIVQTDEVVFPTRLSCVEAGEVIGVIGDARPAPHLHFEVRVSGGDTPGPGYSRADLEDSGWRRPAQVIANVQARLHPAYAWHSATATAGPPLVLDNDGLMFIDGDRMRRLTPDGRVLWRVGIEREIVHIGGFQANPLVFYTDGTVGRVDFDGNPGEEWQIEGFTPDMPPLPIEDSLLFHTADDTLVLIGEDRREIIWTLPEIPAYERAHAAENMIGLVIDNELWLISTEGELIDRAELRDGASMATYRDGALVVYSRGGLWRVEPDGTWSELIPDAPAGGGPGALAITEDGRVYLMDGGNIYAYSRVGALDWEASLPDAITGRAELHHYGNVLLLLSTHGDIMAIRDSGGICGFTRLYGDDQTTIWHDLGDDDVLRVAIGDQIIGLDWERFLGGC